MEPWSRLTNENEPQRWYSRFLLYRDFGPDRSLLGAFKKATKSLKKPSETVPGAWKDAFERWNWKARAEAYDAYLLAEKEARAAVLREIEAAEIERIMTTDYATKHKRVQSLTHWAHEIEQSFVYPEGDPDEGKVNPKWLNPDKLREWRGMLDDIAKELGHRVKETKLTGKDGGAIEIITSWGGGQLEDNE